MPIPGTKRVRVPRGERSRRRDRLGDHSGASSMSSSRPARRRATASRRMRVAERVDALRLGVRLDPHREALGAGRVQHLAVARPGPRVCSTSLIAVSRTCRSMPSRRCSTSTTLRAAVGHHPQQAGQRPGPVGDHGGEHHPAARRGLAEADALREERGVDVAAGQHGADVAVVAAPFTQPCISAATRHRAGALDDELRALQQQHHRLGHLVVGDRHDLVDVALDERQREVARALDGDAVADRVGRAGARSGDGRRASRCRARRPRPARRPRARPGSRVASASAMPPASPPPPSGTTTSSRPGACARDLEADRCPAPPRRAAGRRRAPASCPRSSASRFASVPASS